MNSNKKMAAVQDKTTHIAAVNTYKNTEDDENEIDLLDMGMALLEKLPIHHTVLPDRCGAVQRICILPDQADIPVDSQAVRGISIR